MMHWGIFLNKFIVTLFYMVFVSTSVAFSAENGNPSVYEDVIKAVKNLPSESAEFSKAPFQIDNSNILLTLGVLGATSLTYAFDKDIQQKLQANTSRSMNKAADVGSVIGDPFVHIGIAALVYGTAVVAESSKWREMGIMMGEALILSDASSLILKEATGRGRPDASSGKADFKPFGFKSGYDSFPSMHTSSSFALASILASAEDTIALKTSYYLAAGFVAFSRVYKNKHWASDVVFGAALGELSGRVVTNFHTSEKKITLVPQAYESGAGLALVGIW